MVLTFELDVTYEDGHTERVVADQRDLAAYEVQFGMSGPRAMSERTISVFRWLAWSALTRTGRCGLDWTAWSAVAVYVDVGDDEEAIETPDPGRPAAPDGAS